MPEKREIEMPGCYMVTREYRVKFSTQAWLQLFLRDKKRGKEISGYDSQGRSVYRSATGTIL